MSQSREPHEPFVRHGDQLEQFLQSFWQRQVDAAENEPPPYGRHPPLPLARIKKVMKSDPDVRMIASDAPVLFCKACEIFIQEITCRAFLVADAHKRRTISKADIAKALAKSDHFDFLIDVVPRDEAERAKTQKAINHSLETEEALRVAEVASIAAGSQSAAAPSGHHQQGQISPTTQQQHSPIGHANPAIYQQHQPMGIPHHMQPPPQPQPGMHQTGPIHHASVSQGRAPTPLNLTMPHHNSHAHSHSQSQPPPLIPNVRSPTSAAHPNNPHGHSQHSAAQRRPSVTRMSVSPTIPLSSSRMDPPSTLDISGR